MTLEGKSAELDVAYLATILGINVSLPFGGDLRYDQIWDINGKLLKVQVKYPKEFEHGFVLVGKTNAGKYTSEEIDGVATIYEDVLYYVPIENMTNNKKLYITKPEHNNAVEWAADYDIRRII